jgi:hypothetical protein
VESHTVSGRQVARISDKVAEVVARALRKEPEDRFQSAEEMLAAVNDAMMRRGYAQVCIVEHANLFLILSRFGLCENCCCWTFFSFAPCSTTQ